MLDVTPNNINRLRQDTGLIKIRPVKPLSALRFIQFKTAPPRYAKAFYKFNFNLVNKTCRAFYTNYKFKVK